MPSTSSVFPNNRGRLARRRTTARHQAVNEKQQHSPDQRHEESRGLSLPIEPQHASQKSTDQRPCNTQQDGDNEAAGVSAWHQQFRKRPNDQPKYDPTQKSEHTIFPVLLDESISQRQ